MTFRSSLKYLFLAALAVGVAVGCAGQPAQEDHSQAVAAQAIAGAHDLVQKAMDLGAPWLEANALVKQAEQAFAEGDHARAASLAGQASERAEVSINQWYLNQAQAMVAKIHEFGRPSAEQAALLREAQTAIVLHQGARAYDVASRLLATLQSSIIHYTVMRGDTLWGISAKPQIYDDPFRWPLIYKRNADQIRDADLIYPRQVFSIDKSPSAADVNAAVEHARTRGAWSLGPVEESDKAYLGR